MRWRRIILGLTGLALIAVGAVGGGLLWVIRTESGTSWLVRQIASRAGSALEIGTVRGTLLEGISVSAVRILVGSTALEIDDLSISASLAELTARRLVIYQLNAAEVRYAQAQSATSDAPELDVEIDLPISIELRQVSIGSIRIMAAGNELTFGSTSFAGGFDDSILELSDLRTSTAGFEIQADASLELGEALRQSSEFSWSTEIDDIAWSGSGRTSGPLTAVQFEHRLDAPFRLTAAGELDLTGMPQARVNLEWEDLGWPDFELARSPSGSAELTGWLDRVEFTGSGQAIVEDTSFGFLTAGSATREAVALTRLSIDSEMGTADIAGDFVLDSMSWDLDVDARGIDPERFLAGWAGEVAANGHVQGSAEPELRWSVSDLELTGSLRGQGVSGRGGVASNSPGEWQLIGAEVDWGGNRVTASGVVGTALDLAVGIDAPRLDMLLTGLSGHVTLEGALSGSLDRPAFVGRAGADDLAYANLSVQRLSLDGRVSAVQDAEIGLTFEASGISADEPLVETIEGTINGTTASHTIVVDIRPVIGSGNLMASGSFSGESWTGEIRSAVLDQELLGRWSLTEPSRLTVAASSVVLEYSCLQKAAADVCLGGQLGTGDDRLELNVHSFDIAWLQPLIAEPVTIEGLYDASVDLRGSLSRPTGNISLRGDSSRISVSDAEAPLEIPIEGLSIDAELTDTRFDASARFRSAADTSVEIEGSVTEIWTPAPQIDARVAGTWADLGVLSLLSPDVGQVSGLATFSILMSGSLDAPEIQGEANWMDGEINVPVWGLIVDDVDVNVSSRTGRELEYVMSARAGDGTITLTGETLLDPQARWPTTFQVHGDALPAVQLPEAQIVIAPDLEVFTAWPEVNVTGTVAIPRADLNLDNLPARSVTTSPDVVIHGTTTSAPQRPLDVFANLSLVLGDDVRFQASGLDARLEGQVDVDYRSGRPTQATGTLMLEGNYTTLGQTLELDRGQLLFAGPLTNPRLDVRAVRRFETTGGEVSAGVLVTGTVLQPVTRLYSEPTMSDGNVLSYLVVGRPLSDSSRENAEALQTAALSMGITQVLPQIQHFGETIGLDELGLRTSEANTGELMAGKQVSSRLYMRYSYGLINRVGGLLMRFRLTDHMSLETRAGENKAMDLLYTIERE